MAEEVETERTADAGTDEDDAGGGGGGPHPPDPSPEAGGGSPTPPVGSKPRDDDDDGDDGGDAPPPPDDGGAPPPPPPPPPPADADAAEPPEAGGGDSPPPDRPGSPGGPPPPDAPPPPPPEEGPPPPPGEGGAPTPVHLPQAQSAALDAALDSVPPPPVDNRKRSTSHSRLRAYEARRRSAYSTKLTSSSLYWRSFRDLLHSSLEETERAEALVRGSGVANATYAEAMVCAAEGDLDDDGRPVTDPKRRRRLRERREAERARRRGHHGHGQLAEGPRSAGAADGAEGGAGGRGSSTPRLGVSHQAFDDAAASDRGMLRTLVESQGIMGERFTENAKFVAEEVVPELVALREELRGEVDLMERLGDAILDELEDAENEVAATWEAYYSVATKSLGVSTSALSRRGALSSTDEAKAEDDLLRDAQDVWVAEMQYRMSVAYLSACWEKCSSELSKLFASMKETECSRRFRLRELLITFMQRQERLWLSLPSVLTPVLKDLVERPLDRTNIENTVQQSIRVRAQGIQREEQAEIRRRDAEKLGPGLTGVNASEGNFELSSPLLSDLLFKASVIEKRGTGYMSAWRTTLAIITADSFLHLFELPPSVRVQCGSAAEVAFHALVPPVEVPTQDTVRAKGGHRRTPASEWYEHLTPTESFVLPNCAISFKDEPENHTFEIKETLFNVGASKVFGTTTYRRLYLRTVSREETVEWIRALRAPK